VQQHSVRSEDSGLAANRNFDFPARNAVDECHRCPFRYLRTAAEEIDCDRPRMVAIEGPYRGITRNGQWNRKLTHNHALGVGAFGGRYRGVDRDTQVFLETVGQRIQQLGSGATMTLAVSVPFTVWSSSRSAVTAVPSATG
jgi:hypothetical protein